MTLSSARQLYNIRVLVIREAVGAFFAPLGALVSEIFKYEFAQTLVRRAVKSYLFEPLPVAAPDLLLLVLGEIGVRFGVVY